MDTFSETTVPVSTEQSMFSGVQIIVNLSETKDKTTSRGRFIGSPLFTPKKASVFAVLIYFFLPGFEHA